MTLCLYLETIPTNTDKTIADLYLYRIRRYIGSRQYRMTYMDYISRGRRIFGTGDFIAYLRINNLMYPIKSNQHTFLEITKLLEKLDPIIKPYDDSSASTKHFWFIRTKSTTKEEAKAHPII